MKEPYALSVKEWGRSHFDVSEPTAYRIANSEDPPPIILINNRRRIAVGSPHYQQWLERRTQHKSPEL